jgi:aldehyde dehydrogenase (NAD+)
MRDAARTMKRVTLEHGGKSPTIILDDVDLDTATTYALSVGFFNSGQSCVAGTRILLSEAKLEEVKALLKMKVVALKVGNGADPATQLQPMVTSAPAILYDRDKQIGGGSAGL